MAEMSDGKKSQKSKETLPNTGEAGGSLTWLGATWPLFQLLCMYLKTKRKKSNFF